MSSKSRRVVRDRKYVRPGDSQPKSRAQVVRRFPDNVNLFKLKELVLGITTFSAGDQYLASLSGQQVAFLYHVGSDAFNSSDIELSDSIPVTSLPRNCKLVLDLENVVGGVTADEFREIFATLTRDDSWGEYQLPSTEGGPVCNGYRVQDNSKPIEVERQLPIRTVDLGVAHVLKKYVRGSAAIARHTSPPSHLIQSFLMVVILIAMRKPQQQPVQYPKAARTHLTRSHQTTMKTDTAAHLATTSKPTQPPQQQQQPSTIRF